MNRWLAWRKGSYAAAVRSRQQGIVDQDYITHSGDTGYVVGQRLVICEANVLAISDRGNSWETDDCLHSTPLVPARLGALTRPLLAKGLPDHDQRSDELHYLSRDVDVVGNLIHVVPSLPISRHTSTPRRGGFCERRAAG